MAYTILIADDEAEIRDILHLYLEQAGFHVVEAADGLETLSLLEKEAPDLLLLDIMMPKLDGYRVLKTLRENSNIPVIILSAKGDDSDKILGLDMGADDYITKPFQPLEAVARVKSNLRRFYSLGAGENQPKEILQVRDLTLHVDSCILKKGEETIDLTSVEFRIMRLFMENPNKVFTKQQLYEQGWEDAFYTDDNNVMVCISKLRGKLSEDPNAYIRTIRGLGYRVENTV